MPVTTHQDLDKAYQSLVDIEIEDDSKDFPCAVIKSGVGNIRIQMISEWYFYKVLIPMRDTIIQYYINSLQYAKSEIDAKKISEKVKLFAEDIDSIKTTDEAGDKAKKLSYIFEDQSVRNLFYRGLKKMRVIPWWVTWRRYQKKMRPIDSISVWVYLWLFNFSGVKKKGLCLMKEIIQDMNSQCPTESSAFIDFDTFKKMEAEGNKRVNQSLANSKESNTSA